MSDPTIVYLEADDEITTVVRRLREADPGRVIIVAPGRSRATSSAIALRLLARAAKADGRDMAVVGDALTRSLAADAGIEHHASVEEARASSSHAVEQVPPQTAPIHVVRGGAAHETAPTPAGGAVSRDADTVVVPAAHPRPMPPARRPPPGRAASPGRRPPPGQRSALGHGRRPPRRRLSTIAGLAIIAAVVVVWGVIGAMVLPAASVAITPRSEPVGPVRDVIAVADPVHLAGTVEEAVTITPTGSYEVNQPAAGSVTFFNWNFFAVEVPAGAFVAAGEQAFSTDEAVTVPAGSFDPFGGGITAGEAITTVTAVAPGPAGNVAAEAIDTVVDRGLAAQLRGFPTITERLVTNPEPTLGGETATGVEITQEDVDRAVVELQTALEAARDEALGESESMVHVDVDPGVEPVIDDTSELVGTRDPDGETARLDGTLAYDRYVADPSAIEERAIERFGVDQSVVPVGWQLDPAATTVRIGEAQLDGGTVLVSVTVSGVRGRIVDRATVIERIIGLSAADAEAALADLGSATVELWPGWVSTVPDSDWRIDLQVAEP